MGGASYLFYMSSNVSAVISRDLNQSRVCTPFYLESKGRAQTPDKFTVRLS